jgi:hypothetical protein
MGGYAARENHTKIVAFATMSPEIAPNGQSANSFES